MAKRSTSLKRLMNMRMSTIMTTTMIITTNTDITTTMFTAR